jgi:hypothetical protein
MPVDHRAEILALYRERFGREVSIPHDVWHRAPQLMRDRGWPAEQALRFILEGGDWRGLVATTFAPRAKHPSG